MKETISSSQLQYLLPLIVFIISGLQSCNEIDYSKLSVSTKSAMYDKKEKLWAHKVYSHKQGNDLLNEFNGLETDIIFDIERNIFDIRHNEEGSFKDRSLDDFFYHIKKRKDRFFWLDFKNLNKETVGPATKKLNTIIDKYDLRKNIIVESWNASDLNKLGQTGIFTSYWVPYSTEDSLQKNDLKKIKTTLYKFDINSLSAHYSAYPFLAKNFPNCNLHLWTNGLFTEEDKRLIKELSSNDNVKVILVDYTNNFLR